MTISVFKSKQWYKVIEDYSIPNVLPRLRSFCYDLRIGDRLRFRGPNMGRAEFLTVDGRLVILKPKVAFRVVGHLTNR